MTNKAKIGKVVVKAYLDENPDTSWLGEFSNTPTEYALCAIGEREGEFYKDLTEDQRSEYDEYRERDKYRFFNTPADNYNGEPEAEIRKYCLFDYKRIMELERGHFCFLGIKAEAEILTPAGEGSHLVNRITSGGLWGIESDSNGYKEEVAKEQLAELKTVLLGLKFTSSQVRRALGKAELKLDDLS